MRLEPFCTSSAICLRGGQRCFLEVVAVCCHSGNIRKNPHAHKNKIGTSTPPPFLRNPQNTPLPKRRNFMGMGAFQQKEPKKCQALIKLAQPFPAPKYCGRKFYGHHASFIDLLMGLFRGAVFRHGWGALKQPIKQPTETPTSTSALMGRFPSLMGRFPTLMGRFTDFVLRGRFTS